MAFTHFKKRNQFRSCRPEGKSEAVPLRQSRKKTGISSGLAEPGRKPEPVPIRQARKETGTSSGLVEPGRKPESVPIRQVEKKTEISSDPAGGEENRNQFRSGRARKKIGTSSGLTEPGRKIETSSGPASQGKTIEAKAQAENGLMQLKHAT